MTDRARLVDGFGGKPTVTLTVPGDHFMRLVGGRDADPAAVATEGDARLGEAIVAQLGFMIRRPHMRRPQDDMGSRPPRS